MKINKVNFTKHGDNRGQLIAIEECRDIPFNIKRVYYMYNTTRGVTRGKHSHKHLQQILVCLSGSCKILLDNGVEKSVVELNKPDEGLYISNNIWREMFDFTPNCILMAFASEYYNEDDYIRNYDEFLKYIENK